jgi:predicted  nucleic acid-binding Zn-ribbon protein
LSVGFPLCVCFSFCLSRSVSVALLHNNRLREQLKLQSNELLEQQKLTKELQIKFTDLQGQIIPKQFELSKILQEKSYLENEVTFIRSELTNKENQERVYRKETNDKLSSLENEILSLKRVNDEKNGKIDLLTVRRYSNHLYL